MVGLRCQKCYNPHEKNRLRLVKLSVRTSSSRHLSDFHVPRNGHLISCQCRTCTFIRYNHNLGTATQCNSGSRYDYRNNLLLNYDFKNQWLSIRTLHTSSLRRKEESNVTKTVKVLKKEQQQKGNDVETVSTPKLKPQKAVAAEPKKTLTQRFVAEVKHYYHGFRLLGIDIKISSKLLWQVLRGSALSRRERRQLVCTTSDLFRMVPFLVFLIIPFMEFLLPVAIKLFPNMLPSTFAEADKERLKRKNALKMKLEMAKFLQETIEESGVQGKRSKENTNHVKDFAAFMESIRSAGTMASSEEIKKYSQLFEDEITLDNLKRSQLAALCKLLELQTMGTTNFLRFQIRMRLRHLMSDDKMILKEGVNTLTTRELQVACRERGMRSLGVSDERMVQQLQQWIKLHMDDDIPASLLLLSRAMYLPEDISPEDQLKQTIAVLPDSTADKAKVKIAEITGDAVDNLTKLNLIKQEEEAIKQEREEQKEHEQKEEQEAKKKVEPIVESAVADAAPEITITADEELKDKAELLETRAEEELKAEDAEISHQDLKELETAIDFTLAEKKTVDKELGALEALKEDVSEYQEDLQDLKEVVVATGLSDVHIQESKAARNLSKRLNTMITQMDGLIDELHKERHSLLEDIEVNEVKLRRSADDAKEELRTQIAEKKSNIIKVNELVLAMKHYQKVSNSTRLQKIAEVLDDDDDGNINLETVMKVIQLIGQDNIKLTGAEIQNIVKTLKEETEIEEDEKRRENEMSEFFKQLDEEKAEAMQQFKGGNDEDRREEQKQ
ncbi:mitochondrial proton/calcium exchanger protein-like isoform X2 [Tubulanus polymorphus]